MADLTSICMFQSRNRDACHFRAAVENWPLVQYSRFNLAIEMLVISGQLLPLLNLRSQIKFQSRNRDACHFRNQCCG